LATGDTDERTHSKQMIRRKHRRHMFGLLQWRRVFWKITSIRAGRRGTRVRWSRTVYGTLATVARLIRTRLFRDRVRRPLYESKVIDDFLFAQPVNVLSRLAMRYGRQRALRVSGVSVIVVNYNTQRLLQVVLAAVRRFSPEDTEVIVVDNASREDNSRQWLKARPFGIRVIRLPVNIGHGRALDIGIAFARSPIVITLDSDAFPFAPDWLPKLLDAFGDPDILAAGMTGPRDRLHPACAAIRRDAFFRLNTSMANYNLHLDRGEDPVFGVNTWDTGELLFERLGRQSVRLLPLKPSELGGYVMSDAVYHHPGSTTIQIDAEGRNPVVHSAAWDQAVTALLG
jgi:hypothetical protein